MEFSLDVEWQLCVDLTFKKWSVGALIISVCDNIHGALATPITIMIFTRSVRWITLVSGNVEGILVGFHDIELRTPRAANLICITISELLVIRILILRWHQYRVQC